MDGAEALLIAVIACVAGIFIGGAIASPGHGGYEFLKDQGSALGGVLALIAGVLAYHAGQKQAQAAREQLEDLRAVRAARAKAELYRCKVILPLPFIDLHKYTSVCFGNLELALRYGFKGDTQIANNSGNLDKSAVLERPVELLTEAILHCSSEDAGRIGFFLQLLQIQNSRIESVRRRIRTLSAEHPIYRYEISTYIRDTLQIVAWRNAFLLWARANGPVAIVPPPEDLSRLTEMELTEFSACRAQLSGMLIHVTTKSSTP